MGAIFFKVFIEFVTILLLLFVCVCFVLDFWLQGMWAISSLTRVWTCTPAVEGKVLTAVPPGVPWCAFLVGVFPHEYLPSSCQGLSFLLAGGTTRLLSAVISGLLPPEVGSCWYRMCIRCSLAGMNAASLFMVLSLLVWAQIPLLLSEMPVWVPDPWFILHFGNSVECGSWKSASTLNHPPWLPLAFLSLPSFCLLLAYPLLAPLPSVSRYPSSGLSA